MNIMVVRNNVVVIGHPLINLAFLLLTIIMISCKRNERVKIISGNNGYYWDVMYINNGYRNQPIQGYFFMPNGQHYAYHYYESEVRTPFDIELADTSTPPTIEANLRSWEFLSDTSIQIGERKYIIDSFKEDTISLRTGIENNPIIKLVKIK